VLVIDLASRRVQVLGSAPHPEALFMQQVTQTLTMAEAVGVPQILIGARDRKWSRDVRRRLREADIRVVLIPERAPNAHAYAERFVRSIKEECLDRMVAIGERHFRGAVAESVEHDHSERNHHGLGNRLIAGTPVINVVSPATARRAAQFLQAGGVIIASAEEMEHYGVSSDVKPGRIVASHLTNGVADRTRPLCPYPQVAEYKRTGSTDEPTNFICKTR